MLAADGDQVVYIGPAAVAVPFPDVMELASVHRGAALEAATVSDSHRQPLGGVGEPLPAAQPQGTARPVEDHPGQFGIGGQGSEDLAGNRTDPDHLDMSGPVGAVHHTHRRYQDHLGRRLGLHTRQPVDELPGLRIPVREQFVDRVGQTLPGVANLVGIPPVGPVAAQQFQEMAVDSLSQVFELGAARAWP